MSLLKRLLSMLRGERGRTLEPALGLGGQGQTPNSQATTLFPGARTRFGHYQILEVLGRSSSGAIYRARDHKYARQVALKIPDVAARELPELHARLETEGRMMAVLNHPNLQQVYELGEELGTPYLAVELVMGTSLRSAIEQGIGLKAGLRALVEVLAGLAVAHESRVVHRNINPANIILQDRGPVKIVGFDKAVPFHASAVMDGGIVGTPAYISPEQIRGELLDGRSDLFSVGCVLYEITTGRPPFASATVTERLEKIDKEEPEMPGFGPETEWKALRIVIARALRRNVEDRYADATAMSAALNGALQGLSAEVFPPTQRRH